MKMNELKEIGIDTKQIESTLKRLKSNQAAVVVTGEFSSGKTCFVNAFLNREKFLPTDEFECTPVYIDISACEEESMNIVHNDLKIDSLDLTSENIIRYAKYEEDYDETINSILIRINEKINPKLHIIDCPGTNTRIKEHELITENVLKKSDLVIYIFNISLGDSEIKNIAEIYINNKDIIFVMTHIDDNDGEYYSDEKIEGFIKEAQSAIKEKTGLEEPVIFPVGSKKSYSDRKYINEVIDYTDEFINTNNINIIKKKVITQLSQNFDSIISELKEQKSLYEDTAKMEKHKLRNSLNEYKNKSSKIEESILKQEKLIKSEIDESKSYLNKRIVRILEKYKEEFISTILKLKDFDRETVTKLFQNVKIKIQNEIGEVFKKCVENYNVETQKRAQEEMNKIILESGIDTKIKISLPEFKTDYKIDPMNEQIRSIENHIEQCREDILNLENCDDDEIRNYKLGILSRRQDELDKLKMKKDELGVYVPEYEEIFEESGAETGKKIGQFVGGVADIALLFIPVGQAAQGANAAVKTASVLGNVDKAKDVAKIIEFASKAGSKVLNNMSDDKKDNKRSKNGESVLKGVGAVLEKLSAGYWGEKAGEAIGEMIKPKQILKKERIDLLNKYNNESIQLSCDIDNTLRDVKKLEKEIEESSSVNDKIRKKKLLQRQIQELEVKKEVAVTFEEERIKAEEERDTEEIYMAVVEKVFAEENAEILGLYDSVFESVSHIVCDCEINVLMEKKNEIENMIEEILSNEDEVEDKMKSLEDKIVTLEEYPKWLENMVDEY